MEQYRQEQEKKMRTANVVGIIVTVAAHLCLAIVGTFSGLKYLYPPPQDTSFVVDFTQEEQHVRVKPTVGHAPKAEDATPKEKTELVQSSKAQLTGEKPNEAPQSDVDDHGDVDVNTPRQEIDRRALFSAAKNKTEKDTLAPQTAAAPGAELQAGHPKGNATSAKTDGTPKANLKGRKTVGVIVKPNYPVQDEGIVVVTIWVDKQGNVRKAAAGADGTTVHNSELYAAARTAAMKTKFNEITDALAPDLQQGTITYIFKLTQ